MSTLDPTSSEAHPDLTARLGPNKRAVAKSIVTRLGSSPVPKGLTRREAQILPWLATDLSYAEIAAHFGYSPHYARMLAQRLLRKLGVTSRPAVVARWLRPDAFPATVARLSKQLP
jgi:DNA-binding CsgD family transcriptional regulator